MTKAERQQGLACVACGKPLSNLRVAKAHVRNKSHQLKQKVLYIHSVHVHGCAMYKYTLYIIGLAGASPLVVQPAYVRYIHVLDLTDGYAHVRTTKHKAGSLQVQRL